MSMSGRVQSLMTPIACIRLASTTPGIAGNASFSGVVSVPSARCGVRDAGGALPSTHSSSATNSARWSGTGLWGLRGFAHEPRVEVIHELAPCCVPESR